MLLWELDVRHTVHREDERQLAIHREIGLHTIQTAGRQGAPPVAEISVQHTGRIDDFLAIFKDHLNNWSNRRSKAFDPI